MSGHGGAGDRIRTACPRDCYDTCGIAVIRQGGVVHAVRGDPDHPVSRGSLCGKCSTAYNREWRDPAVRLLHPQRRVGPKGSGRYEAVSWDTAIADINQRFLGHTGPTDVISFNLGEGTGEIIVSAERALAVATRLRRKPAAELALYLVHGLLHIAGMEK